MFFYVSDILTSWQSFYGQQKVKDIMCDSLCPWPSQNHLLGHSNEIYDKIYDSESQARPSTKYGRGKGEV